MTWVAVAVVGTTAVAGAYSARQQNKAAEKAAGQSQEGVEQAQQFSAEAAKEATGLLQPIATQGLSQYGAINADVTNRESIAREGTNYLRTQTGPLDVNQFLNPSIDFALNKGAKVIENSAAARGGLVSGAVLKDLAEYGVGLAQQNYNNAVGQAMANRGQQIDIANTAIGQGNAALNTRNSLYGTGINAVGQQANITSMQGTNAGNLAMTGANVAAAGTAAQRDPLASGLQAGLGAAASFGYSDETLKDYIKDVTDEDIDAFLTEIEPSEFEYTEEGKNKGAPDGKVVGVMAQDMQKTKVGQSLVEEDEDGHLMVDVPKSVGALIATTASLNKRLKKLEKK